MVNQPIQTIIERRDISAGRPGRARDNDHRVGYVGSRAGQWTRKTSDRRGMAVLPHLYAIVNQWPLIALLRRNIAFKVVDVPFDRASWQTEEQLMTSAIGDGLWRKHAAEAGPLCSR